MPMSVQDLINLLEQVEDKEADVMLATQPHWPLAYNLRGVAMPNDLINDVRCDVHEHYNCTECADNIPEDDRRRVVWLVEGGQDYHDPYGVPEGVWDVAIAQVAANRYRPGP